MMRISKTLLAGAALSFGIAMGPGHTESVPKAEWSTKAPLPVALNEHQAAVVGGKIYVIGGGWTELKEGKEINRYTDGYTTEYDPSTDKWRARSPMPEGVTHEGISVLDGRIYVAGGFAGARHTRPTASVYSYDPAADKWQKLTSLSGPRGALGLAAVDGKIHAIGGRVMGELGSTLSAHDVYDPKTDRWTPAAALPTPRSSSAFAEYRGLLFFAGGECRGAGPSRRSFDNVEAYDPKTDHWLELAPLPSGRHGFAAAAVGDKLYFLGGSTPCGGAGKLADNLVLTLP